MSHEPSEHEIQSAILEWLKLKRIFHWRNNSGAMKKGAHFVKFGTVGSPDIFALHKGVLIGIEVKKPRGRISLKQVEFGQALIDSGGHYIIAYDLQVVVEVIRGLDEK